MRRRRKPILKPMQEAVDALFWRARVLAEIVDGFPEDARTSDPLWQLRMAMDDYEASKAAGFLAAQSQTVTGHTNGSLFATEPAGDRKGGTL